MKDIWKKGINKPILKVVFKISDTDSLRVKSTFCLTYNFEGLYDPDCSQKLFDDFKMSGNLSKIEDYSNENYFNRQKYHQIKVASVLGRDLKE